MFFKYHTKGTHKLLVTFLSIFSSAAASKSKVSALECWYGTTIHKCCIHVCCLCNRWDILTTATWSENNLWDVSFSLIDYWPNSFCVIWILITRSQLLHSSKKDYVASFSIKLLEKEENEEKYLKEQWSHVLSDFKKKTSIDTYALRNQEIVKRIPFNSKGGVGCERCLRGKQSWKIIP